MNVENVENCLFKKKWVDKNISLKRVFMGVLSNYVNK